MNRTEFEEKYMTHFSEQQKAAVFADEGPVLLLAVPGGGKTTVLVTRLAYMILCRGIRTDRILTLTYTVAATRDMEARFRELLKSDSLSSEHCGLSGETASEYCGLSGETVPEFRTINGISAKIIQYYGKLLGKQSFMLLKDEKEKLRRLSAIYRKIEENYATESELHALAARITYIKNGMLSQDEINELEREENYHLAGIYHTYLKELRAEHLMDYDDQMRYAFSILKASPETLSHFQKQYPFICVDEAQDTSRIQHSIIRLLASKTGQLFMVGDEDQSIYGFRAAYPQALLDFEQDHEGARVLVMEDNFRSEPVIVDAAQHFISKNRLRHPKVMRASSAAFSEMSAAGSGSTVREVSLRGRSSQYRYLLKVAMDPGCLTAVLFRDNESVLPLIDLLEREQVPYRIRSADLSFFTNRLVTDIRNIILFSENPLDTELFLQIYYKLSGYMTKKAALMTADVSKNSHIPPLEAVFRLKGLPPYVYTGCRDLQRHFRNLKKENASEALLRIRRDMGYDDYLKRSNMSNRSLWILEMLARQESSAAALLQRLDVLRDAIREKPDDAACLFILSTVHSSKGLEYERVFLLDAVKGIFPEEMPDAGLLKKWSISGGRMELKPDERKQIASYEEERRLFYVAVTRARKNLTLFRMPNESSFVTDFLKGIPEKKDVSSEAAGKAAEGGSIAAECRNPMQKARSYEEFCESLAEGLAVRHLKFGEGVVTALTEEFVTIVFDDDVEKKFLLRTLYQKDLLRE